MISLASHAPVMPGRVLGARPGRDEDLEVPVSERSEPTIGPGVSVPAGECA
ncbi:hypothetical protein GCM10022419_043560 [Nonomuraea rosea]|uniref:Uncharacterized protein n=1 Tax=Nonomuraea rosea TaxID=638574 RepID=A0ABP6WXF4_9ACTN